MESSHCSSPAVTVGISIECRLLRYVVVSPRIPNNIFHIHYIYHEQIPYLAIDDDDDDAGRLLQIEPRLVSCLM